MKIIVSNIQRFCLQDGPGIRTTVFFKGCNLNCPWCSNPENINSNIESYRENNEINTYGYEISLEDLEKEILKDQLYYKSGGGVTFSGGECLLQFEKIEELLKRLKENRINICIETALSVPQKYVDIAVKYVDEFIIDIKILDEDNINKINGNVQLYLNNIQEVFKNNKKVIFRIPLVPNYILTDKNMKKIIEFIEKYKPSKVELFKIHRLGEKKYKTLGKIMPEFEEVNDYIINEIEEKIKSMDVDVEYIKI